MFNDLVDILINSASSSEDTVKVNIGSNRPSDNVVNISIFSKVLVDGEGNINS